MASGPFYVCVAGSAKSRKLKVLFSAVTAATEWAQRGYPTIIKTSPYHSVEIRWDGERYTVKSLGDAVPDWAREVEGLVTL